MVKVINAIERNGEKGPFVVLEIQGGLEMVQSQNTGLFYATLRKTTIPCTMEMEVAKEFIGAQIPGRIERVECEAYNYTIPETGESVILNYRWSYVPEEVMKPKSIPAMVVS